MIKVLRNTSPIYTDSAKNTKKKSKCKRSVDAPQNLCRRRLAQTRLTSETVVHIMP